MLLDREGVATREDPSCDSDESSFYGDTEEKTSWKDRLHESDPQELWDTQDRLKQSTPFKARSASGVARLDNFGQLRAATRPDGTRTTKLDAGDASKDVDVPMSMNHAPTNASGKLCNPLEGRRNAKQLGESASDFIKRAPPLDSLWAEDGWLWAANPHALPSSQSPDLEVFTAVGEQYLSGYLEQRQQLEAKNPDKAASSITRMLKPARDNLKVNIEQLAATYHVLGGKWLLFPRANDVPVMWRTVVEAVTENRLGDMAKIATGSDKKEDDGIRVICVYTADFTDEADVRRVCRSLNDLGLVPADRGIWYKADAYTYLNINRDNKFNIPPTSYSSKDILTKTIQAKGTKRSAPGHQARAAGDVKQAASDWTF